MLMKIVRFIDYSGAKSFLSADSTFKLASCKHYRILEESRGDKIWGDKCESKVGGSEFEPSSSLISCWTICKNDGIDWNIFPGSTKGIAVVSTVEKVYSFLNDVGGSLCLSKIPLEHMGVNYYNPNDPRPDGFDICQAMFWKRQQYINQREYRFALHGNGRPIDSIISYPELKDVLAMVDEIHFGVDLTVDEAKVLETGAIACSDNGGPNALGKVVGFDSIMKRIREES